MVLTRLYSMDDFDFQGSADAITTDASPRQALSRASGRPRDPAYNGNGINGVELSVHIPIKRGLVADYQGFSRLANGLRGRYTADFPRREADFAKAYDSGACWDLGDGEVRVSLVKKDQRGPEIKGLARGYSENIYLSPRVIASAVAGGVGLLGISGLAGGLIGACIAGAGLWAGVHKGSDFLFSRIASDFEDELKRGDDSDPIMRGAVLRRLGNQRARWRNGGNAPKLERIESIARDAYSGLLKHRQGLTLTYRADNMVDADYIRGCIITTFNP